MASSTNKSGQKPTGQPSKSATRGVKQPVKESKAVTSKPSRSFLQALDDWFAPRMKPVYYICLFLTVFFGIMLFDVKISTGGDDSSYIEMAHNFLIGKSFPTWHGPLYSILLSIPIMIFGVNVIWLKIISFLFIIGHLALFYLTFRKIVSPAILTLIMLVVSVNASILYFASQTYSEAMYMFLQALIVFLFVKAYLTEDPEHKFSFKGDLLQWLSLGFFIFVASLTRNIGIVALGVMLLILLIDKRFLESLMLTGSYFVFFLPFKLYKYLVWHTEVSKASRPFNEILLKNFYDSSEGYEDFSGMVTRFFENARLYLSKHFMVGIGLHNPTSTDKSYFVTFLMVALILLALYFAIKNKNKIMLFVALLLGGSMAATFISLQQSWDQMRMVVIYIPMLLLLIVWGIQQLAGKQGYGFLNVVIPLLLCVVFFKTIGYSMDKMKHNQKVLAKNIKGNLYYGFTPDWQNFLRMSEWVGKNIPKGEVVASRKPSMSFIYSKGRDFYGMYRFPTEVPEQLIGELKQRIGDMVVIPNKSIDQRWPAELQWSIKRANVAYVAEGSDLYGIYDFKGKGGSETMQTLGKLNVSPFSTDSLINRVKVSPQDCFAVSPDSLLYTLRRSKVKYVIVASLRANPNMNTGNIVNNIQRYLFFVEQKYPGILKVVYQIGNTPEDEPTWLYQINYQYFGL